MPTLVLSLSIVLMLSAVCCASFVKSLIGSVSVRKKANPHGVRIATGLIIGALGVLAGVLMDVADISEYLEGGGGQNRLVSKDLIESVESKLDRILRADPDWILVKSDFANIYKSLPDDPNEYADWLILGLAIAVSLYLFIYIVAERSEMLLVHEMEKVRLELQSTIESSESAMEQLSDECEKSILAVRTEVVGAKALNDCLLQISQQMMIALGTKRRRIRNFLEKAESTIDWEDPKVRIAVLRRLFFSHKQRSALLVAFYNSIRHSFFDMFKACGSEGADTDLKVILFVPNEVEDGYILPVLAFQGDDEPTEYSIPESYKEAYRLNPISEPISRVSRCFASGGIIDEETTYPSQNSYLLKPEDANSLGSLLVCPLTEKASEKPVGVIALCSDSAKVLTLNSFREPILKNLCRQVALRMSCEDQIEKLLQRVESEIDKTC